MTFAISDYAIFVTCCL